MSLLFTLLGFTVAATIAQVCASLILDRLQVRPTLATNIQHVHGVAFRALQLAEEASRAAELANDRVDQMGLS